jgi:hypothetical protein
VKPAILFLTFLCCALTSVVVAQTPYGLGLSDANWKESLGSPTPSGRDAWLYRNGHLYTRSWARKDAPRGRDWNGYVEENYLVKEIRILWRNNNHVTLPQARAEVTKLLPPDAKVISPVYRNGSRTYQFYSSKFLTTQLFPGMAGDTSCITPWGYGVGKFKVEYRWVRRRVSRVVIDVGEPHETSLDICKRL